jgi:hypothetical protein
MKNTSVLGVGADRVGKVPPTAVDAELVVERCADALRERVGRGKDYMADELADEIGVEKNTLRSWVNAESSPPLWKWLRLAAELGPSFVNRQLALIGMTGADWVSPDHAALMQVNAGAAAVAAEIGAALVDGKISSEEQARIDECIDVLQERLSGYQAARQHRMTIKRSLLRSVGGRNHG